MGRALVLDEPAIARPRVLLLRGPQTPGRAQGPDRAAARLRRPRCRRRHAARLRDPRGRPVRGAAGPRAGPEGVALARSAPDRRRRRRRGAPARAVAAVTSAPAAGDLTARVEALEAEVARLTRAARRARGRGPAVASATVSELKIFHNPVVLEVAWRDGDPGRARGRRRGHRVPEGAADPRRARADRRPSSTRRRPSLVRKDKRFKELGLAAGRLRRRATRWSRCSSSTPSSWNDPS